MRVVSTGTTRVGVCTGAVSARVVCVCVGTGTMTATTFLRDAWTGTDICLGSWSLH